MTITGEKYRIFNRDIMKCVALFIMFWGHLIGWVTLYKYGDVKAYYDLPMWEYIVIYTSLFCPPVMFFFVADGYRYTRDRRKYAKRLFVFACITQPFDWLLMHKIYGWWTSNVIFTLFFGLLSIMAWESRYKLWQRVALIVLCDGATVLIQSDWIIFGVLFILFLHIFREKPKARCIAYFILTAVYFLPNLFSPGRCTDGQAAYTDSSHDADVYSGVSMHDSILQWQKGEKSRFCEMVFLHFLSAALCYNMGGGTFISLELRA